MALDRLVTKLTKMHSSYYSHRFLRLFDFKAHSGMVDLIQLRSEINLMFTETNDFELGQVEFLERTDRGYYVLS